MEKCSVSIDGKQLQFGKCIKYQLDPNKPESPIHVALNLTHQPTILHLSLSDAGIALQHHDPCPANEWEIQTNGNIPSDLPKKHPTIGACVMVQSKDRKVLLTQRSLNLRSFPGKWVLPGGSVDPGESLEEAGCREVMEETGVIVQPQNVTPICAWESTFPDNTENYPLTHQHVVVYLLAEIDLLATECEMVLSQDEVGAYVWLDFDDLEHMFVNNIDSSVECVIASGETTSIQIQQIAEQTATGTVFAFEQVLKHVTVASNKL